MMCEIEPDRPNYDGSDERVVRRVVSDKNEDRDRLLGPRAAVDLHSVHDGDPVEFSVRLGSPEDPRIGSLADRSSAASVSSRGAPGPRARSNRW